MLRDCCEGLFCLNQDLQVWEISRIVRLVFQSGALGKHQINGMNHGECHTRIRL